MQLLVAISQSNTIVSVLTTPCVCLHAQQMSCLPVIMPSAVQFSRVSRATSFLTKYASLFSVAAAPTSLARVPEEAVATLLEASEDLTAGDANVTETSSPLAQALMARCRESQFSLRTLLAEKSAISAAAQAAINAG